MLSYTEGKAMKPVYNYYVETDLDTIDDQPIDYSKRYDEQVADDVCGSSSAKKRHHSTPSENGIPNKIPGDELKVYCIEGTPLLISSASSLCDLNEIGALIQASERIKEESRKEPRFREPYSNPSESESFEAKYDDSLEENSKLQQTLREVKENTTQENTSSQTDDVFSKTSSPLMFSRSSSVCSLNSFEQNSIVDDRSSVSIFSNLASGLISPSEIPDSPGEAMSPFIPKRQIEFVFPPQNDQKSMEPVLNKLQMNPSPPFIDEDVPEDNMKVYNDEGDSCSVSNLSELSIDAGSLNGVGVNVFPKSSLPVVEHQSSMRMNTFPVVEHQSPMKVSTFPVVEHQSPIRMSTFPVLEHQSAMMMSSFPVVKPMSFPVDNGSMETNNVTENRNLAKIPGLTKSVAKPFSGFATRDRSMTSYQDKNTNISRLSEDEERYEKINFSRLPEDEDRDENINFSRLSEDDEEDRDEKINFTRQIKGNDDHDEKINFSRLNEDDEDQDEKINFSRLTEDDDDDQDEKINFTRLTEDEEDSKNGEDFSFQDSFEQSSSSFKKLNEDSMPENESPDYSKDYSDDDSDALLGQCIQSGMPASNEPLRPLSKQPLISSCHGSQEIKTKEEEIQHYIVSYSNCETSGSSEEDMLLQDCIQLGLPQNPHKDQSNDSNIQLKSSNTSLNIPKEMDVAEASDEDDYAVLQHIIDFGKPKIDSKLPCTKVYNPYSSGHKSRNVPQKMDDLEASDEERYNPMQQHTELSKPKNKPQLTYSNNVNASNSYSSSSRNQNGAKVMEVAEGSDEENDAVLQDIIDFGKPKSGPNISSHANNSSSYSAGPRRLPVPQEMDVLEASDEEDYSPMLQSIIEFGKPKLASHNNANASHSYSNFRSQGYREKQPDGSSDDDQDILTQCIQTGMPKPRQPYSLPTRTPSAKPQPSRQPLPRDHRATSTSSLTEQQHAFRKSPSADYRTLYAKVNQQRKSPTKVINSPLRNSSATKDKRTTPPQTYSRQRQQHKRCPTPEERAMLLSSFARRSPGRMPLPQNMVQYRTCPERNFYNPANQIRKAECYQSKYHRWICNFRDPKIDPAPTPDVTCTYRTEDTPILSPSASISDLSTLSFPEDRMFFDRCRNNSRNSDSSSESEDEELLRQCIRAGMPSEKRALG